jgi:hypothetical protein
MRTVTAVSECRQPAMRKVGLKSRVDAVRYAAERGWSLSTRDE